MLFIETLCIIHTSPGSDLAWPIIGFIGPTASAVAVSGTTQHNTHTYHYHLSFWISNHQLCMTTTSLSVIRVGIGLSEDGTTILLISGYRLWKTDGGEEVSKCKARFVMGVQFFGAQFLMKLFPSNGCGQRWLSSVCRRLPNLCQLTCRQFWRWCRGLWHAWLMLMNG